MPAHKIRVAVASALLMALHATAAEAARNLVPTEPGKSLNYWCTWSAQSYMQGQGAKDNDPILYQVASIDKYAALQLNEETLFGANGWLKNFSSLRARFTSTLSSSDSSSTPKMAMMSCRFL